MDRPPGLRYDAVMRSLFLRTLMMTAFAAPSFAADVKLGGLVYGQAAMIVSPRDQSGVDSRGKGSFDITRIYLHAATTFDPHWKARITLEGNANSVKESSGNEGQNPVFLKFAFVQYSNLFDKGVDIQGGQIPLPWNGFEEEIWGRRYVQKVMTDLQSVLNSADKGLGLLVPFPKGYGDAHLAVVNGEGTTTTETGGAAGRQKDYMGRVSLCPLPGDDLLKGLRVHAFLQQGRSGLSSSSPTILLPNRERNRALFAVSFQHSRWHLMYDYWEAFTGVGTTVASNAHSKPKGFSVHGHADLPYELTAFGRYDRFDGGLLTGYYPKTLSIVGVERKFNDNVRLAFDGQFASGRRKDTTAALNEAQLAFQVEAKF